MLLTAFLPLLASQVDPRLELPKEAFAIVGAWNLTVETSKGKMPGWLEIEVSGRILVGRYVGAFGSARPISRIDFRNGRLSIVIPRQWEKQDTKLQGNLKNGVFTGTISGYASTPGNWKWTAKRAPSLKRSVEPKWGPTVALFDGKTLNGWKVVDGEPSWKVENGILRNTFDGGNLITTRNFEDFRLTAEYRIPKGGNSGLYLRGRYEVQIQDDFGKAPYRHGSGSIYGFFEPSTNASKKAGEWETFEITLVGRYVTVVQNGVRILDRQRIPGITGGARDTNEAAPGPLMIQGDHGPIEFRRIEISPALK